MPGLPGALLRRVASWTGLLSERDVEPGDGTPAPDAPQRTRWGFLHRALRDALTAELLAEAGDAVVVGLASSLGNDIARWAEALALAALARQPCAGGCPGSFRWPPPERRSRPRAGRCTRYLDIGTPWNTSSRARVAP